MVQFRQFESSRFILVFLQFFFILKLCFSECFRGRVIILVHFFPAPDFTWQSGLAASFVAKFAPRVKPKGEVKPIDFRLKADSICARKPIPQSQSDKRARGLWELPVKWATTGEETGTAQEMPRPFLMSKTDRNFYNYFFSSYIYFLTPLVG